VIKEQNQMAQDVPDLIATLEDERYAAMLSGDKVKLDRLMDDRLRYVHSNGREDDKVSYMDAFGRLWQYQSIDRQDQTIVPLGDTALVYSILHMEALVGGVLRQVHSRALAVWHISGGVWRVVSIFSVGLPTTKP
jgi:hypothetical protein